MPGADLHPECAVWVNGLKDQLQLQLTFRERERKFYEARVKQRDDNLMVCQRERYKILDENSRLRKKLSEISSVLEEVA